MLTADGTVPACVTIIVCPAMLNDPILLCELLLAVTDQLTEVPAAETEAHETFELAVAAPQVVELGNTVMIPEEAPAPALNVPAFTV